MHRVIVDRLKVDGRLDAARVVFDAVDLYAQGQWNTRDQSTQTI
jgi:hypothetical protein